MTTANTRRRRSDREESHSSDRSSLYDYDSDEVRRRWRLSTPPRVKSLTKEEAREIIDRQSMDEAYTGYTYGDSISYRSDGSVEYQYPYLIHRKRIDFGSGGDVTSYRPASTRYQRRGPPFYTNAWNWVRFHGMDMLMFLGRGILRLFLLILQTVATIGMLLGSVVRLGYLKSNEYVSSFSKKTSSSPLTQSPRRRLRVSFASSPMDQISFRQTSTPITSTPAPTLNPGLVGKTSLKYLLVPLHVYVWSATNKAWDTLTNIIMFVWDTLTISASHVWENLTMSTGHVWENLTMSTGHIWEILSSIKKNFSEALTAAFAYSLNQISSAYSFVSSKFFKSSEPQTPKRRGRPPKTPFRMDHHSYLSPLKDGASWTANKMEKAAALLVYFTWAAINQVSSTVTYIQNNYTSAHKSRNWLPLILLFLMLLSLGFYGYHNRVNNGRTITTALYQDSQVLRQRISDLFGYIPSPWAFFNAVAEQAKRIMSAVGTFISDIFQTVRQGTVKMIEYIPNPLGIFEVIGDFLKRISLAVFDFFGDVYQSTRQGVVNFYDYLPSPWKMFGVAGEKAKQLFYSIGGFLGDVASAFVSFFGNLYSNTVDFLGNTFLFVSTWFKSTVSSIYNLSSDALSTLANLFGKVFSAISNFIGGVYQSTRQGVVNFYSYLPSPWKMFGAAGVKAKQLFYSISGFLGDVVSAFVSFFENTFATIGSLIYNVSSTISSFIFNVFDTVRQWLINVYNYVPSLSTAYNTVTEPIYNGSTFIYYFIIDSFHSLKNWAFKPVDPIDAGPEKQIVERVLVEKVGGLDINEVEKLINERISQYDADKTGKPDYALESSGGSILGIGCTKVYEETSRLQSIFGIPLYFSNYSPRTVIQRRANSPTAGECWPYVSGHGELFIKLSHKITVTSVSYEHLSPRLSPEGHMKTAPKNFRVWSIHNYKQADERKHLLGEYVYVDGGEALQTFETQFPDDQATEMIELETTTNHGSPVTCLYRFRVHGKPDLTVSETI